MKLDAEQLTGRCDSHLLTVGGIGLQADCWKSFEQLRARAAGAGFDLQVASGFRSFSRQLQIWNGKAEGRRPVHDDRGRPVDILALDEASRVDAILRFSALPGSSRHHWGTDLDVFDAAAMPAGYRLQLSPEEWAEEGMFGPLDAWLTRELTESASFYRPYDRDRGGVAVEPWHLSHAPLAQSCHRQLTVELLAEVLAGADLALAGSVLDRLPEIFTRYIDAPPPPPGPSL